MVPVFRVILAEMFMFFFMLFQFHFNVALYLSTFNISARGIHLGIDSSHLFVKCRMAIFHVFNCR